MKNVEDNTVTNAVGDDRDPAIDRRRSRRAILVTGAPRSGTTWVGKMLGLSRQTYYLGEVFNQQNRRFHAQEISQRFLYIPKGQAHPFAGTLSRLLALDFNFLSRKGVRRYLPSRLLALRYTRRWLGLPRPILKDPIAVFSSEWLAERFDLDVVCLIRHPAAFVASMKKAHQSANWHAGMNKFQEQPQLIQDWLAPYAGRIANPPDDFVERAALDWLLINHVLTGYARRNPQWAVWRLEDISADPVQAFGRIYNQVRLPYTPRIHRRVWEHSRPENGSPASGAQATRSRSAAENLHQIKRDSRAAQREWLALLTPEEVQAVRRITEPVAQLYYAETDWATGYARVGEAA